MYQWVLSCLAVGFIMIACGGENESGRYTAVMEGTIVKVPALTGGQIIKMYIDTGDSVRLKDDIALIDTADLVFQRMQLEATLAEIEAQFVIARTNVANRSKDLDYVSEKHDRLERLLETNSIPRQTYDDISNQLSGTRLALETARQNLNTLRARKQQVTAQLKSVGKKISDCLIRAPMAGIITSKYYETGEAIPSLSPVVEITYTREMEARIYVSQTRLPDIRHGHQVTVHPDGTEETISGVIQWISPKAEFTPKTILTPDTRTSLVYAVEIRVRNENGILKHGMPVTITL